MLQIQKTEEMRESCFRDYLAYVHQLMGITIGENRKSMLVGRVRKRVQELDVHGYEEYLKYVKSSPDEQVHFINLITTNKTYFYRTPRIWEYISNDYLPKWQAENRGTRFSIWSAASSSGEEVYTLAMLCQQFKDKNPEFLFEILGTDISTDMVRKAGLGEYDEKALEFLRAHRPGAFHQYLKKHGDLYKVTPQIKTHVRIRQHNLFKKYPGRERFHLVLLRNVLIYFTKSDQERVLSNIASAMEHNGVLIIGESESISQIESRFCHLKPLIYRCNNNGDDDLGIHA